MLPGFMKYLNIHTTCLVSHDYFRGAVIRIMKFYTQELDSSFFMKKHKEITHYCQGWEARARKLKAKVYNY